MAVLGGAVLLVALALRPWLFAVCQDEEFARVAGLPVRALNLLLAVTTAVTVTVAMRAVGLLLVSALMVVPVAAAQLVTRGFRRHHVPGDGARRGRRRRWAVASPPSTTRPPARPSCSSPSRSSPRWRLRPRFAGQVAGVARGARSPP